MVEATSVACVRISHHERTTQTRAGVQLPAPQGIAGAGRMEVRDHRLGRGREPAGGRSAARLRPQAGRGEGARLVGAGGRVAGGRRRGYNRRGWKRHFGQTRRHVGSEADAPSTARARPPGLYRHRRFTRPRWEPVHRCVRYRCADAKLQRRGNRSLRGKRRPAR